MTLIEIDWPRYGEEPAPPAIPLEEYRSRLAAARVLMDRAGLTHLAVYGDREHFANLHWFTGFDPRFEEALLLIRMHGPPLLLVGNECESYLPVSPLWRNGELRHERYQPFSLLSQPRDASRQLGEILDGEGMKAGARVGCVGFKYYAQPHSIDMPAYLVDAIRAAAGFDAVTCATRMLLHPGDGLRTASGPAEIAWFEYSNFKASEAMRRVHFAIRLGMTDHELLAHAGYDGLPLACHMTLKTGPNRISLASPSGARIEIGYPWSANVAYWGSNVCRAGWVARDAADLPQRARGYVEQFAGPYFHAMRAWFGALRIGTPGGEIQTLMDAALPFEKFGVFLNPGHLIHFDEWTSSPVYPGSQVRLRSGMVLQSDVIPSSKDYFSTRMEDGYALADQPLRKRIAKEYPACLARCQARREFMSRQLGIELPEEVLPLSNMAGIVPPYLLRPELVLSR
ncbi:MAG: hypothetical protein JNK48_05250 [Bryobacterales bacterium]|nr:hypothetical protein [Bryobacterales bacterium]